MGKKSVKENKNIYQISREDRELTREQAAEEMVFVSADRIEKIENERSFPHPDEILAMAECYKRPSLCNYYCSHECPIGQKYVPEVQLKDLSQVTLEVLSALNNLEKEKNRLVDITVDGKISVDEYGDFINIKNKLDAISNSVSALRLWVEKSISEGEIDKSIMNQ